MNIPNISKGPWNSGPSSYSKKAGGAEMIHTITRDGIRVVTLSQRGDRPTEAQANATAIAALPDLLEALEDALEEAPACNPQDPDLLTGNDRCPEEHRNCCGACAHYYKVRSALIKAGYTFNK